MKNTNDKALTYTEQGLILSTMRITVKDLFTHRSKKVNDGSVAANLKRLVDVDTIHTFISIIRKFECSYHY